MDSEDLPRDYDVNERGIIFVKSGEYRLNEETGRVVRVERTFWSPEKFRRLVRTTDVLTNSVEVADPRHLGDPLSEMEALVLCSKQT